MQRSVRLVAGAVAAVATAALVLGPSVIYAGLTFNFID
jgi:hypothetical protein